MKAIHTYSSLENEIEVMKDGSIEIELADGGWIALFHQIEAEDAEKIYEALKSVFDPTAPA